MGYLITLQKYWNVTDPNYFMLLVMKEILKYEQYYDQFKSLHGLFKALNYKIIKGLVFNMELGQWVTFRQNRQRTHE